MIVVMLSAALLAGSLDHRAKSREEEMAQVSSAGFLGCLPEDIKVSEFRQAKGRKLPLAYSWRADCRKASVMCGFMMYDGGGTALQCSSTTPETIAKLNLRSKRDRKAFDKKEHSAETVAEKPSAASSTPDASQK